MCALALAAFVAGGPVSAAGVLRSAQVAITVPAPTSCQVSMTLIVEGAAAIEHRIEALDGTTIDGLRVEGATPTAEPQTVGRTRSLTLTGVQSPYTLSYRVQQPAARAFRCPLWLPTTPADGVSRAVKIQIDLPAGTTPGNTMPRLTWTNASGVVTLAHLPAFVLVPFTAPGEAPGWDVASLMDLSAVLVFVVASAIWLWRRKVAR